MSEGFDSGRQRGDLRVDLKPGRLLRFREAGVVLEMTDAELLRQCVDLALPQLLAQVQAVESGVCRQNAAIYGSLAANTDREVRALDDAPSLRVEVREPATKTPQFTDFWRQNPLPLPVPHPHPHTHERREGDLGSVEENPSAESVCLGEVQEGDRSRQTAATPPRDRRSEREEFRVWIAAYPLPIGEAAAWRAWQHTRRQRPPLADMLAALESQKRSARWREGTIPNPAKYLRDGRWSDPAEALTPICTDARTRRAEAEMRALQAEGLRGQAEEFDPAPRLEALAEALPPGVPDHELRRAEIRALAGRPLPEIEKALEAIGARCVAALLGANRQLADAVEFRARQSLAALRGRLPPIAEAEQLASLRRRLAADELKFPALTLWAPGGIER